MSSSVTGGVSEKNCSVIRYLRVNTCCSCIHISGSRDLL